MKVLMFGWEFPPFISGGLGTATHGITRGLHKNNVDITLVLPTKKGQEIETGFNIIAANEIPLNKKYRKVFRQIQNFDKKIFDREFDVAPYFTKETYKEYMQHFQKVEDITRFFETKGSILQFTGNYGKDLMSEVQRYSYVGEIMGLAEDFDVIHAHDWLTYFAGVAAKNASGKKLVAHVHATEFDRSGENVNQTVYDIERYGMHHADQIIAVSYYTKNIIVNRYGIDPAKVSVVHNAVNKEKRVQRLHLKKNMDEKIILFLGRVTMQKGPDYFLEAAFKVLQKIPNVRFVMAGSGDMLPRMINRMAQLRIIDRFHFTGFLKGIEVEKMYALSDIYVMPSVSEPFGISPFEALLYDVPIIISKQSGVAEVLNNALKVDFWDVDKMAEMMIQLLENEEVAREVVDKSQKDLENIGWETAGAKINKVYHNMVINN